MVYHRLELKTDKKKNVYMYTNVSYNHRMLFKYSTSEQNTKHWHEKMYLIKIKVRSKRYYSILAI